MTSETVFDVIVIGAGRAWEIAAARRHSTVALEAGHWDRLLPDRFGPRPGPGVWVALAGTCAGGEGVAVS